jgi:AraC-like DNA-binding protein
LPRLFIFSEGPRQWVAPQLEALTAMHEAPKKSWKIEDLADVAGMSRTRFAEHFRTLVGQTPLQYLTVWRMTIARQPLGRGNPVKSVAAQVGYDSAAAFSRVFSRVTGQSPREFDGLR